LGATINAVKINLNPTLDIQGVVLTMYDKRTTLSDQVAQEVRAHFPDKVYETVIPRNVRISEAPSHGLPAIIYDQNAAGSKAYISLAKELIDRERMRPAA
jgi:chromosome partitioning protein